MSDKQRDFAEWLDSRNPVLAKKVRAGYLSSEPDSVVAQYWHDKACEWQAAQAQGAAPVGKCLENAELCSLCGGSGENIVQDECCGEMPFGRCCGDYQASETPCALCDGTGLDYPAPQPAKPAQGAEPVGEVAPMMRIDWNDHDNTKGIALVDKSLPVGTKVYAAAQPAKPSVLYHPKIMLDGNQWCALYGDNLQDGVAGFGSSPDLAMRDFDRNWQSPVQEQPNE